MSKRMPHKKQIRRFGAIERSILAELSAGDLLYGFLLSARSTRRMYRIAQERANDRYRHKQAIERLKRDAYISETNGLLSITESGLSIIESFTHKTENLLKHPPHWDGTWRMIVFDIPEQLHVLRNRVRRILKRVGFVQLQQSVWVFPYECRELVSLLQEQPALKHHILLGVLASIDDEEQLLKHFKLTR